MTNPPQDHAIPSREGPPGPDQSVPDLLNPEYIVPGSGPLLSTGTQELLAATANVAQRLQAQCIAAYVGDPLPYSPAEVIYMLSQLTAGWSVEAGAAAMENVSLSSLATPQH